MQALFTFCMIAWTSGIGILVLTWGDLTTRRKVNGIFLTLIAPVVLACMMFVWIMQLMHEAYKGKPDEDSDSV